MQFTPPTIHFLDGHTVHGSVTYLPTATRQDLPESLVLTSWAWQGVDISGESQKPDRNDTIHDLVARELCAEPARAGYLRWVLLNDGSGEIADHLVIEYAPGVRPRVELWHAKAAHGGTVGVKVSDMQVVAQQSAKSRRHVTDRDLWNRIGRRLLGEESPAIRLLSGDRHSLLAICGRNVSRIEESSAERPSTIDAHIVVVQPGLSLSQPGRDLQAGTMSAGQVRKFLVFLSNAVQRISSVELVGSP